MNETNYYASLSAAMTDINSGTNSNALADSSAAAVKVSTAPTGRQSVILLGSVSESTQIDVNKSIDLVLNGNTLTFTDAAAHLNFSSGTVCRIDGTVSGSKMVKTCDGTTADLMVFAGDKLTVKGGTYELSGGFTGNATTIKATAGKLDITDCTITDQNNASTDESTYTRAIQGNPGTDLRICNSTVAASCANNMCVAVMVGGQLHIENAAISGQSVHGQCRALVGHTGSSVTIDGATISTQSKSGVVCAILNRTDMKAHNATITSESTNANVYGISNEGNMELTDCSVTGESETGIVYGVKTEESAETDIQHCLITANTNGSSGSSWGLVNLGRIYVANSEIIADAPVEGAVGVDNHGICCLIDTDVTGIHSGCQNGAHLYVQGGTFTGWTHGGFYFAPGDWPGTEGGETGAGYLNYVNDAFIRCGYSGRHVESLKASAAPFGACAYIGSGSEITVFMDNCMIGGTVAVDFDLEEYRSACEAAGQDAPQIVPHAIAFLRALGETNNTLYISNSDVLDGSGKFRIDNASDGSDLGHRLYVGLGTNITEDTVNNKADTVFDTARSYRRSRAYFTAQMQ